MIKLFKSSEKESQNRIVQEIHDTFFTEVDRLLEDAKISRCADTQKQNLISKMERLKSLGFTQTREMKEANEELNRVERIKRENESRKELFEAIEYFQSKYPIYKFITEDSVKKICEKYGLVYGPVSRYRGTVPDENVAQMERFKIQPDDECYFELGGRPTSFKSYTSSPEVIRMNEDKINPLDWMMRRVYFSYFTPTKCPLEIAAPLKDFDTEGMVVRDSKLSIPDPIVLQPVFFKGKKHYLIVTAWGLEASDEQVANPKMN